MSSTQVFGNCLSMQCEFKSHVHTIESLIAWSSVFCFRGTFAAFRGGNECYWLREQLFFIMWLNIYSNREVRIINFLMVFSVLSITLKSEASYDQTSWLNNLPHAPIRYRAVLSQKLWALTLYAKTLCLIWDTLSLIYCKFQPYIWQYMFKIQVLLSLLTVLSPQLMDQLWNSFGHSYNENYANSNCLDKAWNA